MRKLKVIIILLVTSLLQAQNINRIEYFVDTDPGISQAISLVGVPSQAMITNFYTAIASQPVGFHVLGIRSRDTNGIWSHTNFFNFLVSEIQPESDMVAVECFWDSDAGFGVNQIIPVSAASPEVNLIIGNVNVPSTLSEGIHTFFVRSRDSQNRWSHTNYKVDIIVNPLSVQNLEKSGIKIYPNPIENDLNVEIAENGKSRLIIYDINGKVIIDTVVDASAKIDMSMLSSGMYTTYFWKEQNKIYVTKLIKK